MRPKAATMVSARLVVLVVIAATATLAFASTASSRAYVFKGFGCHTDAGDIPGVPGVDLPVSTAVLLPSGAVVLTCKGRLPAEFAPARTFVRDDLPCVADPPWESNTNGRLVATPSGEVQFKCTFEPPA